MPQGLIRDYGAGYWHFITSSCYQRRPLLASPRHRDLFLKIFEQVRQRYGFIVAGYVVMPEHIHLLISEPKHGNPSVVMQVLKQRFAHAVLGAKSRQVDLQTSLPDHRLGEEHVWQRRFYDFVVWNPRKRVEKLRYMPRNPVKRGLVSLPEQWPWSSFRHYAYDEAGPVLLNERQTAEMKIRSIGKTGT